MQKVLEAKAQMQSIENDRNEGKEERKQRVRARLDVQKEVGGRLNERGKSKTIAENC